MKKIFLPIVIAGALGLSSCYMNGVRGNGNVTSDIISVNTFDEIEVSHGIRVHLDASTPNDGTIEIVADDNLHNYIETYVEDRKLVIKLVDHTYIRNGTIKVYVDNNTITSLDASGGSRFDCHGEFTNRKLDVSLSGGSRFRGKVDVNEMDVDVSGGSTADIEGICDRFEAECSGGSGVSGYSLTAYDSTLDVSGGSHVEQTVTGTLRVNASGGSSVRYKGSPELRNINTSGGSKVVKAD